MRDSLLKWQVHGELTLDLVNVDDLPAARRSEVHAVVQRMMDAQAWGTSLTRERGRYMVGRDEQEVDVLEALLAAGIVQKLEEHEHRFE